MKNIIISTALCIALFATTGLQATAHASVDTAHTQKLEKGKRKKSGRYKKRKHRLKKFLMGKRYCDCPKH